MDNTTYCIGYWNIRDNKKNSIDHYLSLIPKTLDMIGDNCIDFFYQDDNILDFIIQNKKTNKFNANKIMVEDLPTYYIAEKYIGSRKDSFRDILAIWTSKLFLVEDSIKKDYFQNKYFAWADASISKMNGKRKNWDFMNQEYDEKHIYLYDSNKRFKDENITTSAGFIKGSKDIFLNIISLYKNKLEKCAGSECNHDEETLMYLIFKENKNLFKNI
ncbi:hypothetical protein GF361_02430 [Candidatus Woesearchaeota archaeon]|nr:hypothetical protein [Candidatus Woesearchaeota archaeon]